MIALKSDSIWSMLGDEPGCFGYPWPPYRFECAMRLREVKRKEALSLGLTEEKLAGRKPSPELRLAMEKAGLVEKRKWWKFW